MQEEFRGFSYTADFAWFHRCVIGMIIACLDTCHELLTRVSIRFIGSLMPTRPVSSGRRGSPALSSTSCPSNCFNIPKRSFVLSAGVDRTSLTYFDRRIPWLMKPPGCFCFLDSFVCLSKLLALFFSPLGCFFFCLSFPSDWSGLWLYSMSGIWCPKKGRGRVPIWELREVVPGWWEFDEKWRSLKIHEDSVSPFRDSCASCPVLCSSGSWYGEEIQIRTNISHPSIL
jgi:hypothetical protein